jgi:hypothetical protein
MKRSTVDNLLDAIKRKAPANDLPESADPLANPPALQASPQETPKKRSRVGRPVQFWMHEEDRRILRELSAWLAGQGVRASDSLVIRTALRSAKTGNDLLQAYHEAAQLDGRLKLPNQSH